MKLFKRSESSEKDFMKRQEELQNERNKIEDGTLKGVQLHHARASHAIKQGIHLGLKEYQIYGPYDKPSPCIGVGMKFKLADAANNKAPIPPCNSECTCSVHMVFD